MISMNQRKSKLILNILSFEALPTEITKSKKEIFCLFFGKRTLTFCFGTTHWLSEPTNSLLVFILIVGNSVYDHEDAITHCSEGNQNEIYMSDLVTDKVEGFVSVDNVFCLAGKRCLK